MDVHTQLLIVTFALIVLDFVSGIVKGAATTGISSSKMREGLYHKGAYVISLVLAYLIEFGMMFADLGFSVPMVSAVCVYIMLTEVASIIENVGAINPDLQDNAFLRLFESSKKKGE